MKKIIFIKFILLILLFSPYFCVYAVTEYTDSSKSTKGDVVTLDNPLTGKPTPTTPNALIGQLINGILGVVGSLALAMFIYGGLVWMTAAGSNEKVQKGKDIILWATLGLVVIFSSYALVKFVIQGITATAK